MKEKPQPIDLKKESENQKSGQGSKTRQNIWDQLSKRAVPLRKGAKKESKNATRGGISSNRQNDNEPSLTRRDSVLTVSTSIIPATAPICLNCWLQKTATRSKSLAWS